MNKINAKRISILGILLSLMITLKYVFGFIPGVELISFCFIIFGILLPFLDLIILIISFNLLVLAIYGFGSWWIIYWILWPIDSLFARFIFFKITKKNIYISIFGFFCGFLVFFWYFLSDLLFYGSSYAKWNLITSIPINLIEGFTTMISILTISPSIFKIFNIYRGVFWPGYPNVFYKTTRTKKEIIFAYSTSFISLGCIVALFSCNSLIVFWKQTIIDKKDKPIPIDEDDHIKENIKISKEKNSGRHYLSSKYYNYLYNDLKQDEVYIVVIANNKVFCEKILYDKNIFLYDEIKKTSKIIFEYKRFVNLGFAVLRYKLKKENVWSHGNSSLKIEGQFCPIYYIKHQRAGIGISNCKINSKSIYEFSYDE